MSDMNETKQVLLLLLRQPYNKELEVKCRLGTGEKFAQRVRVEISRLRAKAIAAGHGKRMQVFKLKTDVLRAQGQNFDRLIFTKVSKENKEVDMSDIQNIFTEIIEEHKEKKEQRKIVIKRAGAVA